ncbi:MAG: M56 family metallopeptidase, partial [Gemmatimonadetes bacterium]|nr:M56 family metallopeptidase [Gemmatimonadota bacterium]
RGATALTWRMVVVMMTVVTLAALLPTGWRAWVLPEVLVAPLQSLVAAAPGAVTPTSWPQGVVLVWAIGALVMLARWIRAQLALAVLLRDAVACSDLRWRRAAVRAAQVVPTARPVRLLVSRRVRVPMAAGWWHPVMVVPAGLDQLTPEERLAVLVHERAHIASGDPWVSLLLRILGVVGWFHPAVWMATRQAGASAEGAADEWVLAAGVRPSTYASLLGLRSWPQPGQVALGLGGRGALRQRLRWITSGVATPRPRLRRQRLAMAVAGLLAAPLGTVQLAPTRGALDGMMQRDRWESRAFAVTRLALRADTVAVAQAAAVSDPSPQVRAAARAALARAGQ